MGLSVVLGRLGCGFEGSVGGEVRLSSRMEN